MTPGEEPAGLRIERLGPQDWRAYRDLRLAALIDSPRAFWTTYASAAALTGGQWRDRLGWPTFRAALPLATGASPVDPPPSPPAPPAPAGLVALWRSPEAPDGEISLVQMWVATWARGRGVAHALVDAAVRLAREDGWERMTLEVAEENERAVRFYARVGFEPTGRRATMPWDRTVSEVEMVRDLRAGE